MTAFGNRPHQVCSAKGEVIRFEFGGHLLNGASHSSRRLLERFHRYTSRALPKIFYVLRLIVVIHAWGMATIEIIQKLTRKMLCNFLAISVCRLLLLFAHIINLMQNGCFNAQLTRSVPYGSPRQQEESTQLGPAPERIALFARGDCFLIFWTLWPNHGRR